MNVQYVSGHSYPHTGSLAYPLRTRSRLVWKSELLLIAMEHIHPANLGQLPPDPRIIAYKAEQMGLAKYGEFMQTVWF